MISNVRPHKPPIGSVQLSIEKRLCNSGWPLDLDVGPGTGRPTTRLKHLLGLLVPALLRPRPVLGHGGYRLLPVDSGHLLFGNADDGDEPVDEIRWESLVRRGWSNSAAVGRLAAMDARPELGDVKRQASVATICAKARYRAACVSCRCRARPSHAALTSALPTPVHSPLPATAG